MSPTPENPPTATLLDSMIALAAEAADYFEARFLGFDYSVGSLQLLDDLLDEAGDYYENMSVERRQEIVEMAGAYLFEVARKAHGGQYFWYDAQQQPILVAGLPEFEISLLAYDKVRGRLVNGAEDNIPFFYQGFAERVQRAKPGDKALIV